MIEMWLYFLFYSIMKDPPDVFESINSIPIKTVLDALWITYRGDAILEQGKTTNGFKINVRGNYINDFSNDRASWWPFAVVKKIKWFSSRETFQWFCENFNICWNNSKPSNKKYKNKKKGFRVTPSYHLDW
jgi:hypothetical protein